MSAEAVQSIILAAGAGWFAWLHVKRKSGPPALFAALYLAFPALGLACQSVGLLSLVEPGKWASVAVTGLLTAAFVVTTYPRSSPYTQALANVERLRQAEWAREDAERAARERAAAIERAELRGRAYAVAALLEA